MYLTKEKQEIMVKNLNHLMRKNNITNSVMQEAIFTKSDKNGYLVGKYRIGKKKFTIDDAICISEFFNIQIDVFTTVDLALVEENNILINEGMLRKEVDFEKEVFYTFREIGAYNYIHFILLGVLLTILLGGSILSYFKVNVASYLFLGVIVLLALLFIFLMLKGISEFIYSKKTFILKEDKQYYFINTSNVPIAPYCTFIGVLIFFLLAIFGFFCFCYTKYLIPLCLIGFFMIAIHIYSLVLLCLPKQKYMQKIDYTLYCFEAIRKYSLILLFLGYVSLIFFAKIDPLYEIIFCIGIAAMIILSEFANRLIINYYESYTGREERIN